MSTLSDMPLFEIKSNFFKALGHPTRLAVAHFISDGEMSVGRITELVGGKMSNVSRHLAKLKEAGAVIDRKHGVTVYYRLNLPLVSQVLLIVKNDLAGHP